MQKRTTIQIEEATLQKLRLLKIKLETYTMLIERLIASYEKNQDVTVAKKKNALNDFFDPN